MVVCLSSIMTSCQYVQLSQSWLLPPYINTIIPNSGLLEFINHGKWEALFNLFVYILKNRDKVFLFFFIVLRWTDWKGYLA